MGRKYFIVLITILKASKLFAQYYYVPPAPLTSCHRDFSNKIFTLTSDWMLTNDQDVNCVFTIKKFASDVCSLTFNFKRFALRSAPDCQNEYLMIGAEKLCGSFSGYRQFPFQGDNVVIKYRGHPNVPLNIDIEQINCPTSQTQQPNCNVVSRQLRTEITSPNYPQAYPPSSNCQYTILPANRAVCQVSISFLEFFLEESFECEKDKLLIGSDALCGRLTGYRTQKPLENNLILRFISDSSASDRGFRILIDQIPCDDNSRLNLNSSSESQVRNQPSFYPEIFPYPPTRQVPQAPPTECCNRLYNAPYMILTSPGFLETNPGFDYNCLYTIVPASPLTCRLRLRFKHFWVGEKDVYYNTCVNGFLEVDNQRFCGCLDGYTYETYFPNGPKEFWLNFRANHNRGFIIEVFQEECPNGFDFNFQRVPIRNSTVDPNTEIEVFFTNITSERAVSRFFIPKDTSKCSFWGLPDWVDQIRVFLLNAAVPSYCPANVNQIVPPVLPGGYYPPDYSRPDIAYPYPDRPNIAYPDRPNIVYPNIPSPDRPNIVYPNIPSPDRPNIVYPIIPHRCQIFNDFYGYFQSPRYPAHYPPNQKICYRFRQYANFCSVRISFLDFDLEWSFKCWKDFLLMDRTTKFCGQSLQAKNFDIPFRQGFAHVDFVSDKIYSGRGFRASYVLIPCNQPLTPWAALKSEPLLEKPEEKSLPSITYSPLTEAPVTAPYPPAKDDDFNLNVAPE